MKLKVVMNNHMGRKFACVEEKINFKEILHHAFGQTPQKVIKSNPFLMILES